ncbi:14962_t:CDS:2 [Entrophospora sp. SA101]|nr:4335_t:CDS:2 [Entrophospora sp. SA101]CAJ0759113.1 14962_t:CDS:2 [Entrophospora sp. SA101]CAJ0839114.1 4842_t:CDS:2 [Entrophospora sp. SA101]CAJ0912953.1 3571_t:CDS:2 [Entrophospora sp. SA101]
MPIEDPRVRLRKAAFEGNLHIIKRLTARISMQNPDSENGWHVQFARFGHEQVVEFLLQRGHEDPEISRDFENNTVLMIAAQYNHLEIMKLYAAFFPNSINMCNKQGQTALIFASKHGHLEIIDFLLEYGADINQTDYEGNTALHYAAAWDKSSVVTMLIERECQFAVKNIAGWTALDYSYSMNLKEHLQECARTHHENKIIRRRNNLKINIESSPLIDSMPFTIRSATFPLVKSNDFLDNNNGNSNNSSISSNLSSNDINAIKRKESLPW